MKWFFILAAAVVVPVWAGASWFGAFVLLPLYAPVFALLEKLGLLDYENRFLGTIGFLVLTLCFMIWTLTGVPILLAILIAEHKLRK